MQEVSLRWSQTLAQDNVRQVAQLLEAIQNLGLFAISQSETAFGEIRNVLVTGIMIKEIEFGDREGAWISIKHTQGKITVHSLCIFGTEQKVRGYKHPYIELNGAQITITSMENGILHKWIIAPEGGMSQIPAEVLKGIVE